MFDIEKLHDLACKEGRDTYVDPISGFHVMTRNALLKQGSCCDNGCRHCPYEHINVVIKKPGTPKA